MEISAGLALGETQGTAYEGSKGAANAAAITNLQTDKAEKSEMSITDGTGSDADKTTIQLKSCALCYGSHCDESCYDPRLDLVCPDTLEVGQCHVIFCCHNTQKSIMKHMRDFHPR